MNTIKFPALLFFCFVSFISCTNNKEISIENRKDAAFKLYHQAKEAEDIHEKLNLLSKASAAIQSSNDSLLQDIWNNKIYYFNRLQNNDSALFYTNLFLSDGIQRKDSSQIALAYYRRGRIKLYQNDHLGVLENMYQSQKYYLLSGDSAAAGKRLVELGIAQYRLGDFTGSQNSQTKALELLENSGDSIFISRIYNNLAMTYRQLNDLDEAIDEYQNSLKYVRTRSDSISILNNLANIYREKGDFDSSVSLLDFLTPIAIDKTSLNRLKDNYYFTRWLQSQSNVEDSLKIIMEFRLNENDLKGLLSSYDHLSRINLNEDAQEALTYADMYYQTAHRLNSLSDEIQALSYLIQLSPAEESRKYSLEFMRLNDSISIARNRAKNYFAKIRYDEEKKLEEIAGLEKLTFNQKMELLQERNRRNFAILLGLLLLAAALFLYYYLKQRHKKDTVKKIHDTEARISKKIHDELANDVFNVMTELENPTHANREATLNKLESIYERTRNISRANTAIATGPDYKEHLHYMLSRNTPKGIKLFLAGFQEVNWEKMNYEARIVIFRVLQELMINMKKHSNASIVSLNFRPNATKLQILYKDNGVGFSSEALKKGSGIQNVENRIASLGGSFTFQSDKKGLSIQIQIPL